MFLLLGFSYCTFLKYVGFKACIEEHCACMHVEIALVHLIISSP